MGYIDKACVPNVDVNATSVSNDFLTLFSLRLASQTVLTMFQMNLSP